MVRRSLWNRRGGLLLRGGLRLTGGRRCGAGRELRIRFVEGWVVCRLGW